MPMRLEFTYTPEDLAEAAKGVAATPASGGARRYWRGILGWALFIGLALALFFLRSQATPPPAVTTAPRESLFARVLVPLVPWLLIFGFIWFFVFRQLRKQYQRVLDDNPHLE